MHTLIETILYDKPNMFFSHPDYTVGSGI